MLTWANPRACGQETTIAMGTRHESKTSLVTQLHDSPWKLVLAITGGGSGALAALLETPGASRTVLEAIVPYSETALKQWLGTYPEQACSAPTARALAMAAWIRARQLDGDTEAARPLMGVGATASLATTRPKRGAHRVHVATQTADETRSWELTFEAENRTRGDEEQLCCDLLLLATASTAAVACDPLESTLRNALRATERIHHCKAKGDPGWRDLLLGNVKSLWLGSQSQGAGKLPPDDGPPDGWGRLVFPGAFNPLHAGHLEMARIAQRRIGEIVCWELSLFNVDKPPLDYVAIQQRLEGLRQAQWQRPVVLTNAPTFSDKVRLFPGAVFVVGVDTLSRIGDPAYYDHDPIRRDQAIAQIAEAEASFLVFARVHRGALTTLASVDVPPALKDLCHEVSPEEFRLDVSSTELRRRN
jgi:glycerol-3-phosphate cytidylyltransferase-like family protein